MRSTRNRRGVGGARVARLEGMSPFHKILVPTDFSQHSAEAVRTAAALSKLCHAPLTLLTVYQPMAVPLVPEGVLMATPAAMQKDYAEAERQLAEAVKAAKAAGAIEVASVLGQGAIFDEIIARARDGGFDLIVMGTHGRTGLKHAFLGSVAEKIVQKAPCAVLTVRVPG